MFTVIDKLKGRSALDACYNSSARTNVGKCTEGTRDRVIQKILNWFNDSDNTHRMLWMSGPAGCGKTTIAQTVADIVHKDGWLGASFFFGFGSVLQFVATIAYQLCIAIPGLFERVISALQCDPTLLDSALSKQMEKLVVAPLRELSANASPSVTYQPWLVLVDGIDECDDQSQQEILPILKDLVANHPFPLRVFISSRDAYTIRRAFTSSETLALSGASEADDVRAFYASAFKRIKENHPELNRLSEWPTTEVIDTLIQKAGLFSWAYTVVKFIDNSFGQPDKRLQQILTSLDVGGGPIDSLETVYANILKQVPVYATKDVQAIMSWLIFGREKIKSMSLCDKLFDLTPGRSAILLAPLMSVINVPDPRQVTLETSAELRSLGFFHTSFPDMLNNLRRLQQHNLEIFYCDPSRTHAKLAGLWINYYGKHGNDHDELTSSIIKGGRLIEGERSWEEGSCQD